MVATFRFMVSRRNYNQRNDAMSPKHHWQNRRSMSQSTRKEDYRTPYERDYSRIIHSAAFRRLQRKTQVLGLGDGDFYRTRLTHTIEVSQIAYGICCHLSRRGPTTPYKGYIPDHALISSICATHDIGHPPFGHGGEIALNYMMREHGGFEGNAQTLNILVSFEEREANCGFDLTRRKLLGIIKYPSLYSKLLRSNNDIYIDNYKGRSFKTVKREDWKAPKCIFDKEQETLDWILSMISSEEKSEFTRSKDSAGGNEHRKTIYKSFDCSIMEIADDISYGVHDLEDAIHLNMINRDDFEKWFRKNEIDINSSWSKSFGMEKVSESLFSGGGFKRKECVGRIINALISSSRIVKQNKFADNVIDLKAVLEEDAERYLDFLKDLTRNEVVRKPEVQSLEYRGQVIIMEIFQAFQSDPDRFFSGNSLRRLEMAQTESQRMRVICDHVAGMTDDYATKIYQRFFVPDTISVFQKL